MAPSTRASHARPQRLKIAGTVLALIRMENGRQLTVKLHQLSITGGLLALDAPLDEGITVELIFQMGGTTVRQRAKTLFPLWATKGCMQPFEFAELDSATKLSLQSELQQLVGPTQ